MRFSTIVFYDAVWSVVLELAASVLPLAMRVAKVPDFAAPTASCVERYNRKLGGTQYRIPGWQTS